MNERRSQKKKLKFGKTIYTLRLLTVALMLTVGTVCMEAQDNGAPADTIGKTTTKAVDVDVIAAMPGEAAEAGLPAMTADSILATAGTATGPDTVSVSAIAKSRKKKEPKAPRDLSTWKPNPQRAMWLAMVLPGAGQIYNRKYWKLPIFYGGMMGCIYAMNWNNMMYKDYSQAYLDIMDDDPNTKSYENMLPLNYSIEGREDQYKEIFKNKKNYYRKYRDMSIFAMIAVYLLSVVDAYVDAELSSFDISKDLSLRIEPAVFNIGRRQREASVGVQCNLNF